MLARKPFLQGLFLGAGFRTLEYTVMWLMSGTTRSAAFLPHPAVLLLAYLPLGWWVGRHSASARGAIRQGLVVGLGMGLGQWFVTVGAWSLVAGLSFAVPAVRMILGNVLLIELLGALLAAGVGSGYVLLAKRRKARC